MAAYFERNWLGRELGFQVLRALFANYHGKWASAEVLPIFLTRKMAAYFEANWQGRELGPQVLGALFANYQWKGASVEVLPVFFNWKDGTLI